MERLALHMEATVLHTSGLSQAVAHAMLERWGHDGFGEHVGAVRDFYRQRCDVFLAAAERHLCGLCEWSAPDYLSRFLRICDCLQLLLCWQSKSD